MHRYFSRFSLLVLVIIFVSACGEQTKPPPPPVEIVESPEKMDGKAADHISALLENAGKFNGRIDDSIHLRKVDAVNLIYSDKNIKTAWSSTEKWLPLSDSLFNFIGQAKYYGLFPEDYHYAQLASIRDRFTRDTAARGGDTKDAALWARADLMLTDAFVSLIEHIKFGRLPKDSVSLRKDTVSNEFYTTEFNKLRERKSIQSLVDSLEPTHPGYHRLKQGIKQFLDSADMKPYALIAYPNRDTFNLKLAIRNRLVEAGLIDAVEAYNDSLVAEAIKDFQQKSGLTPDGKAGQQTINRLNDTDRERYIRIAITLDRYKLLPEQMPQKYLWVNIPSFYMQLRENDSTILNSKIVVGKPHTRTPVLTSAISEIITYPQWTVPQSIITKEILPEAKKDPGYFARKGFSLLDVNNEQVDPWFVDWTLFKKNIPYRVVQGSGDDNALGILKFNFSNKYSVYLHDTNQRYLFGRASRALSHGCVRVQEWEKLTYYILKKESEFNYANRDKADSVRKWLSAKEKRGVSIRNRLPLFIRYFTCEGKNEKIIFHEDIYGEDKRLRDRYFANKL